MIAQVPRRSHPKHRREDEVLERDLKLLAKAIGCSEASIVREALRDAIDRCLRDNGGIRARFEELRGPLLRSVK
jgi:hypothetical protein